MAARAVMAGSVIEVVVRWLQGETSDMDHCRTNAGADRGLCRVDTRVAFVHTRAFSKRI